jgi:3'-phosphoadenosine 5'-phosphosulfate sulfotransferase (PAPS reductase)/FAD synthetase
MNYTPDLNQLDMFPVMENVERELAVKNFDEAPAIDFHSYNHIIVAFSGGKDSTALFLYLLDQGVPASKIELWHHEVDGREEKQFMDWPVTKSYCEAFAKAFNVPIYFSWKKFGFRGEMLRNNSKTAAICFEDENGVIHTIGGVNGKNSTRLRYPQVSPDLSVRWCSSYLKIDICTSSVINQERFKNSKTLILSGERGEESKARAGYEVFEVDRADNRKKPAYEHVTKMVSPKGKPFEIKRLIEPGKDDRHVDRLRPIRDWSEQQIWDIIKRYRVRAHVGYYLGWARLSCLFCIFGNKDQFKSAYYISPSQGDEVIGFEKQFGCTIKRNESIEDLLSKGKVYPAILENEDLVEIARSNHYPLNIILDENEEWKLPSGAFKEGCGPS